LGYVGSTSSHRPWKLIALEEIVNRNETRWIERELKKSRGKRVKWIKQHSIENGLRPGGKGLEVIPRQSSRIF